MSDPRRLRLDDGIASTLIEAARGYDAPPAMHRRVLSSLGLPVPTLPPAAPAPAATSLASIGAGKTWVVLAVLAAGGGGYGAYHAATRTSATISSRAGLAEKTRPEPPPLPPGLAPEPTGGTVVTAPVIAPIEPAPEATPRSVPEVRRAREGRPGLEARMPARLALSSSRRTTGLPAPAAEGGAPTAGTPAPSVAADLPAAPASVPAPAPVVEAPRIVTTTTLPAAPAAPQAEALAAEIALLDQAATSLRRRSFQRALGQLEEHDRRFPGGALAEEASVLNIAARLGLGDRDGAQIRARRFLDRHGDSVLAARVRSMMNGAEGQ